MAQVLRHTGGIFQKIHDELVDFDIDFDAFQSDKYPADRLDFARKVWAERVQSEFRSIQIMTRFTAEVLGAGDPLEVYAGAADAVLDEIRHTALCVRMLETLGGQPMFPDPVYVQERDGFLNRPMAERALGTAISMLAINETLSTGFIQDLQERCTDPVVKAVLDITLADEDTHFEYGWKYVENSIKRFNESSINIWRDVAATTLRPHETQAARILETMGPDQRDLALRPEPELAALGLFSPERQVLVYQKTLEQEVRPRLAQLGLL
ncbi:MAG: hypothetical protein CMH54_03490 [Myxococcales bacterium]|nr:hypothetical protein [Myxococcales bacterium]|tara:strand:- start:1350 stop:2150 length:801 start_codon:yes stop_codon:yes gene_type:complete